MFPGTGSPLNLPGSLTGPFEYVEQFRNLKFTVKRPADTAIFLMVVSCSVLC